MNKKLSQLHCGDEVFYQGEWHIAIKDARKTGDTGEAASLATVMLYRVSDAGVHEDGKLELGSKGYSSRHVPDQVVPSGRTGVRFHGAVHRSEEGEDGRLRCEKNDGYTTADARRSELTRCVLRRKQLQREQDLEENWFRRQVGRALEAGVGVEEIRQMTGLSRARIYQIRDGRR